jgi:ribonuclease P protein component
MISRSHRLSTKQFNEVIKKGRVTHSPLFLMRVLQIGEGPTRIAAAVPVKVARKAVSRNAMRRKVYEAVRPLLSDIKEGFNIILFAKTINMPANKSLTVALISNDLKGLFVKAAILR